jgi:hypothetical protein
MFNDDVQVPSLTYAGLYIFPLSVLCYDMHMPPSDTLTVFITISYLKIPPTLLFILLTTHSITKYRPIWLYLFVCFWEKGVNVE